jgi:cysteine-rich repeat protein
MQTDRKGREKAHGGWRDTGHEPARARAYRARWWLAFLGAVSVAFLAGATGASAACGDGVKDGGELCDDGNLADGDCCTSSCQRPTACFASNRGGMLIKEIGDDRDDRLFWRYYQGQSTFEDWGDPTDETAYSFCVWDDDELKIQARIEPGGFCHPRRPCWKVIGRGEPQAYQYFNKATNDTGIQRLIVSTNMASGDAYISVRGLDVRLGLPGPVAFDRYFTQSDAVRVQLVRSDAPVCWEHVIRSHHQSIHRRFKAILPADG